MNNQLQQKLLEKYPKIFKINNPPRHPFDMWQFESWNGWYDLIDRTAAKIQEILDKDPEAFFETTQSKQKWSLLRWYFSCDNKNYDLFRKIIDAAEKESSEICESCGTKENVNQRGRSYILTLCEICEKKDNRE